MDKNALLETERAQLLQTQITEITTRFNENEKARLAATARNQAWRENNRNANNGGKKKWFNKKGNGAQYTRDNASDKSDKNGMSDSADA